MIAPRSLLWLVRHAWYGAWRRWTVAAVPALLALVALSQLPRALWVGSLFADPARRAEAIVEYASLVDGLHGACVIVGSALALALGAATTGGRGMRSCAAPLLARPISRASFLLARGAGHSLVLATFWLVPLVVFEALRIGAGTEVGVTPAAYLLPLALHVMLLAGGMALGCVLPALPAALGAALVTWGALFVEAEARSLEPEGLATAASACIPPVSDLLSAAAPFASLSAIGGEAALLARCAAWSGIFFLVAIQLFERADLAEG